MTAPIALFAYKRVEHLKRTVDSLGKNELAKESDLYVFCDAPKRQNDMEAVKAVREFVRSIVGFKSLNIVERKENYGLAKSIIQGVTELTDKFGDVIVVEDDMILGRYFLTFMNDSLNLYRNDEKIMCISGYIYPIEGSLPETFFIKGTDCWGWATWKRAWANFEPSGIKLLGQLKEKKLLKEFDYNGAYPFSKMLKNQIQGRNDSWAIRFNASAYVRNMLTLYPNKSFVKNIGQDGSGEHCESVAFDTKEIFQQKITVERSTLQENLEARSEIEKYFRSSQVSLRNKIKNKFIQLYSRFTVRAAEKSHGQS